MSTDDVRVAVWDALLTADMNVRYWNQISYRYSRNDTWTKIFLAATSSSTVATWGFWAQISWVWKSLSAVSALLAVALPILNWNKKVSAIADLHGRWIQIRNEHETLWRRMESGAVSDAEAEITFQNIRNKEAEAETHEVAAIVKKDKKLLDQCYQEVLAAREAFNRVIATNKKS
jgi:hypothetical protein